MDKIFEIRFIVPPMLTAFFVFLQPPEYVTAYIDSKNLNEMIALGTVITLTSGVLISSIAEIIISRFTKWRRLGFGDKEIKKLGEYYFGESSEKGSDDIELGTWLTMSSIDGKGDHVQNQIHKRWAWAMANYNFCVALMFAGLLVIPKNIMDPDAGFCVWFSAWLLFLAIFYLNATHARNSVTQMDRLLVVNRDQIIKKEH